MSNPQIFTLTTDFGTRDGYVGAVKGRILAAHPDACIIDITHDIPPQDVRAAAWCIRRAAVQFPPDTIHLVVVDPGVGSERPALLARYGEQWFVGPDNGVFSLAWQGEKPDPLIRLHRETAWWRAHQSFDGLALFAPAACCLAAGQAPHELGVPQIQYQKIRPPAPRYEKGTLYGEIMLFDHFGNAITNIRLEDLRPFAEQPFSIQCASHSFAMADHYADSRSDHPVAIINSDQLLELACFESSVRDRLRLRNGELVLIQALHRD